MGLKLARSDLHPRSRPGRTRDAGATQRNRTTFKMTMGNEKTLTIEPAVKPTITPLINPEIEDGSMSATVNPTIGTSKDTPSDKPRTRAHDDPARSWLNAKKSEQIDANEKPPNSRRSNLNSPYPCVKSHKIRLPKTRFTITTVSFFSMIQR